MESELSAQSETSEIKCIERAREGFFAESYKLSMMRKVVIYAIHQVRSHGNCMRANLDTACLSTEGADYSQMNIAPLSTCLVVNLAT